MVECSYVLEVLLILAMFSLEFADHGRYMASKMPPMTPPTMAATRKSTPIVIPAALPAGKLRRPGKNK